MPEVEHVSVSTLRELQIALRPFTGEGRENARKLLVDGIQNVKLQIDEHEKATKEISENIDIFGGILPAPMQDPAEGYHYVDAIIKKKLGGKRVGWKVRWAISEGIFEWNPIADKLIKCSGK